MILRAYVWLSWLWFHKGSKPIQKDVFEVTIGITSSLDLHVLKETEVLDLMLNTSRPESHGQLLIVRLEKEPYISDLLKLVKKVKNNSTLMQRM